MPWPKGRSRASFDAEHAASIDAAPLTPPPLAPGEVSDVIPSREPAKGAKIKGFRARLRRGDLTPDDREKLTLARTIRDLRAQNVSTQEIERQLGLPLRRVDAFIRSRWYEAALEYFEWLDSSDDDKARGRRAKEERETFDAFGAEALRFYQDAFRRRPVTLEDGTVREVWESPAMAQWATEKVTKGKGWDQPVQDRRPVIHINVEVKEHVGTMILADEARMQALIAARGDDAGRTIDLTPEALDAAAPDDE